MGGGTILILLLSIFMGLDQHVAQATNLVFFIPTANPEKNPSILTIIAVITASININLYLIIYYFFLIISG